MSILIHAIILSISNYALNKWMLDRLETYMSISNSQISAFVGVSFCTSTIIRTLFECFSSCGVVNNTNEEYFAESMPLISAEGRENLANAGRVPIEFQTRES